MKKNNARSYERWDKELLWHPFTQQYVWDREPTLIVKSGKGPYLYDLKGKKYLDGVSSLWVNLHGHNHPILNRALKEQINKISHSTFLGLSHVPAIDLARELVKIAPRGLRRVFYSDNGATAVEIALKMAYQYWLEQPSKEKNKPRTEFLAVKGSYHGDTIGAVSVGGIGAFHSKFKPLLFKSHFAMAPSCGGCPFNKNKIQNRFRNGEPVKRVPKPGGFRAETGCHWECLSDVEKILKAKSKRIAAGLLEPVVQGAAGMIVQPAGYVAGFRRLCQKYNVLFIADEVATGFCRTGSLFAVDQERVSPDILCLAKAISGGYAPIAATLTTEKIFKSFYGPPQKMKTFFHGHSYTAHPLGAAVSVANLRLIKSTKLLEKTRQKAHLLSEELRALAELKCVRAIRQAGLMVGVEINSSSSVLRLGAKICEKLLFYGIWLRPLGDTIVIMPAPILSDAQLKRLVRTLKQVLSREVET